MEFPFPKKFNPYCLTPLSLLVMKTFLFIFYSFFLWSAGALAEAAFAAARSLIPVTDVCWSCIFPIKLGGITLASRQESGPKYRGKTPFVPAPPAPHNIKVGMNMSFWGAVKNGRNRPSPYCFPSLGGLDLDVGIRAPAHGRTPF